MTDSDRFGSGFVAAHRALHGHRRPEQRQLTYDIAVNAEYEHWRRWYGEQMALLSDAQADALARRLWLDEHFWPVTFELAAGAAIRAAGYLAQYEPNLDGLTPDWAALRTDGEFAFLLEVHTDQPSPSTFGRIRSWKALEQRIATIPVNVVLVLKGNGITAPIPPYAGTAKKIAAELRKRLLSFALTSKFHAYGYTFVVLADRFGPVKSANGLYAQFAAPSGVAGTVSAERLARAVDGKVAKYAAVARAHRVPLVVAVGAHRFTGTGLTELDALLAGTPVTSFQFNIGDTYIGERKINLAQPARWSMPPDLAALLWLHNQPPFAATIRLNSVAPELQRSLARLAAGPT